jgi:hypothetical protein
MQKVWFIDMCTTEYCWSFYLNDKLIKNELPNELNEH